jgi:hypothetical protein
MITNISGLAAFDYGTKVSPSFVTFSVGTQATEDGSYIKRLNSDGPVTLTIKDGVIEFSHPQSHPYIGVGDTVQFLDDVLAPNVVYLNEKISETSWSVFAIVVGWACIPNDTSGTLVKIDKAYSSLSNAVFGASGSITDHDLVAARQVIRIACYEMDDVANSSISITGWTTDAENFIKIFTPFDLKHDCNLRQRHIGVASSGYKLSVAAAVAGGIRVDCDYTEIEGLHIDGGSNTDNTLVGFNATLDGVKIIDNILSNADKGIVNTFDSCQSNVIKGNIIYGMNSVGIDLKTEL